MNAHAKSAFTMAHPAARLAPVAAAALLCACGGGSPAAGDAASAVDGGIKLPAGFEAGIFADKLDRPRHIAVRANGDVYVALRSGRQQAAAQDGAGGIAALRDTDGDGRADRIERFGRRDVDTGVAIHDGSLYYSSGTAVYAVKLDDNLAPKGESELVVGGFGESGGHSGKPIVFDGEGHLYLQAGTPSNACQAADRQPGSPGQNPCPLLERFGGIWRYVATARNQDQMDGNRYSTGHRNVVAMQWNPAVDRLYFVMHGRDQLDTLFPDRYTADQRSELPAEEFHVVAQGDDFGWPYTYYDPIRNERMVSPEYGGDGKTAAEPGKYKDPLIGFPAHWAPDALLFYTGTQFPERYRNGAFIAFHGSWNRETQDGYNVVFVPLDADGKPSAPYEIFAHDFEGPRRIASPADAAHRPTGLAQGPDGSLYVSDDVGGRIWKIRYTGQ
jgi:glucose/arabinose dehydrogenase